MIRKPILTCLLILFATSVSAALDKATIGWLDKLDASLAKHDYYEKQRLERIQQLKDGMAQAQAEGHEFEQTYALYNEYKSYCYDSARHYSYACLEVANRLQNNQYIAQSKEAIAFSLVSAGILSEANDVIMSVDRSVLSGKLLEDYYEINSQLWRSMADYVREDPFYTKYITIRRKNHKLLQAHKTIDEQLEQLKRSNLQLQEDDKIKIAYIGRSFYTNAEYIAKLEKIYLSIDRKIAARQYDDLQMMVKLSTLNNERNNMYESFDQTFLKLFPQFVERYNALFEEKDRKDPPNSRSLMPEMRIFALIRLGITDNDRIAKFLGYSSHTISTYKTRIKNRSIVDNEQFERLIMEI